MARLFEFPYRTVAEISLQAIAKNLAVLRNLSQKEVIPIVKADAYGHGMVPISRTLFTRASIEMVGVATLEEALFLRREFKRPMGILVLSGFLPHQLDAYSKYRLTPMIHSLSHLKSLSGHSVLPDIHLKLDTGMNRLGIKKEDLPEAMRVIEKLKIKLCGFATHFAQSEVEDGAFTAKQLEEFEYWYKEFKSKKLLNTDARIHAANSGGIIQKRVGTFTTSVRAGISLYGISPNRDLKAVDLVPVLEWKARVLTVKDLEPGDQVGYGGIYKASKKEKIAILPVGYADGYPRILSNVGKVILNGKTRDLRGRVSMDMIAVDCTGQTSVKEGTQVTLIGVEGKQSVSVWDLAMPAQTIPYEILCGLSQRVPRVYLD